MVVRKGKNRTYGLIRVVAKDFPGYDRALFTREFQNMLSGPLLHLCLLDIANRPQCC